MYLRIMLTLLVLLAAIIAAELAVRPRPASVATPTQPVWIPYYPGPPDLEEPCLNRRISSLQFKGVKVNEALSQIAAAAKVNLVWSAVIDDMAVPLNFTLTDVTVATALEHVLRASNPYVGSWMTFSASDNVIVIIPGDVRTNTPTRLYPVRDLLEDARWAPPQTQPATPDLYRSENVGVRLSELIESVVASDSWRNAGGNEGSIREWNGILVITQTSQNHAAVQRLLTNLRNGAASRPAQ